MLRKTVLSLKSPTGAFIAPLRCANANLFNKVQEKLAKNKKAPARHKAEESYLLTTKLYCGKCGALMFGESGVSHTGKMYTYYKCAAAKKKKTCDKKAVRKQWLEDLVVNKTMKLVEDDASMNAVFLHPPQDILHVGVVQRLAGTGPAHRLYNVDALAQQVQPDGIGKHMVVLQNRDAILDRSLYLSVGVLGEHFFHIFNGSGSAFFADFFAQ